MNSFFNPIVSLVCAFLYSFLASFTYFSYAFLIPILYLFVVNFKNINKILKKLITLNIFIFFLFLTLLISSDFNIAFDVYLRANLILFFNLCLFFSSSGYDLVRGLNSLKFPSKLISSMYFSLKMIEFLSKDIKQVFATLKIRGFKANNSFFTYETFGNIIGMIFIKSIRKSQALRDTCLLRSFNGNIYLLDNSTINKNDYFLSISIFFMFILKGLYELFF